MFNAKAKENQKRRKSRWVRRYHLREISIFCFRTIRPALVFLWVIVLGGVLIWLATHQQRTSAADEMKLADIPEYVITEGMRVLVFAPHPDDEVLGAGGLIADVMHNKGTVEVVIVTNGDGQWFAPALFNGVAVPKAESYIHVGRQRQQESLDALAVLGLNARHVHFLGYPDGHIADLWSENWHPESDPLQARYTRARQSPYADTYNAAKRYHGFDLFSDLYEVITTFQPDLIVATHPMDQHSDHSALSNYVQLAAAQYMQRSGLAVDLLTYLVHYDQYPERGLPALLPPETMEHQMDDWQQIALSEATPVVKRAAVDRYLSQLKVMRGYLHSFVQSNELFYRPGLIKLDLLDFAGGETTENDPSPQVLQHQTAGSEEGVPAAADITGWYILRMGDLVCLGAETLGVLDMKYDYHILVRDVQGEILTLEDQLLLPVFQEHRFAACLPYTWVSETGVFAFSAEVKQRKIIDQTAWHVVLVGDE